MSITDSGDESTDSMGDRLLVDGRLGRVVLAADPGSRVEVSVISELAALESSPRGTLTEADGRSTKVAWLDAFESLDLDSCLEVDLETHEPLDDGLVSGRSASFIELGVSGLFLCAARSVSGGDGGLSSCRLSCRAVDDFRTAGGESADFDRLISLPPKSVVSGVSGSVRRGAVAETSSLLWRNSLLCALLNDGYGTLPRSLPMPRESSGTRSVMDLVATDLSSSSSLSMSFVRWRRWDRDCTSLSVGLNFEDLDERWE